MAATQPRKVLYSQTRATRARQTGHILYIDTSTGTPKVSGRLGGNAINMIKKAGPGTDVIYNSTFNVAGRMQDVYQALLSVGYDAGQVGGILQDPRQTISYATIATPEAAAIVAQYAQVAKTVKQAKPPKAKPVPPVYTLEDVVAMKKFLGQMKPQTVARAGGKTPGTPQGNKKQAYSVRLANAHAKGKGLKIAGFATKATAGASPIPGPRSRFRAVQLAGAGGLQGTIVVDNRVDLQAFAQALAAETGQAQLVNDLLAKFDQGAAIPFAMAPQVTPLNILNVPAQPFVPAVPAQQFTVPAVPAQQFAVPAVPAVPAQQFAPPQPFVIPAQPSPAAAPRLPTPIQPVLPLSPRAGAVGSPRTPGGRRPGAAPGSPSTSPLGNVNF